MRRRHNDRMWMTWQEAYCEAVAHDAEAALRGCALQVAVLIVLVLFVPTVWVTLPAAAAGVWVVARAIRWSRLLRKARTGRIYPPR
ncbi:hypothetical protein [Amycolatopsis jiangsuensis]|uniref:Uncharacterized protein n=1 Tax=Amycolatopsis jiangsuensis TaxID=1181879 RepID=A0A840IX83_9PSEU|nr:hypothetical protein [Amycolatopsis jiangsuensis]MBB4687226.1 hypothetical protein [Amycolatopsis jiangsuensis]